ncbi:MAG: TRAP transporter small permease subunit [Ectothiorhodospiraceae bacterium]|jgi:TRAP-type mannitol/chloroaromatic compound transport system permease small subunit
MPSLTFVLPHWMYWSGLLLFPLLAMFLVGRERRKGTPSWPSLPIAYLLWLTGGFVGLHRFYLRSLLGVVYIPLFLAILYGNVQARQARLDLSSANNDLMIAQFELDKAKEDSGAESEKAQAAAEKLTSVKREMAGAESERDRADMIAGGFAAAIAVLLVIDAVMIPVLARKNAGRAPPEPAPTSTATRTEAEEIPPVPESFWGKVTWGIDRISGFTGRFVAYWSLVAVFVYYYEVIARYVFNSPTNWAHESMFLMFGMQYLIGGAFALREDNHVRVDVVYQYLPRRGQAVVDVITSIFFFIFTGALLWTGWTFASDSMAVWEVSFTEWAIQYWTVKLAMPIGAALILLQGIARLIRDIAVAAGTEV